MTAGAVEADRQVPLLDVSGVSLRYGSRGGGVVAVERVSFAVRQSERVILLGPSGCGKSSLLKSIAGYIGPAEGLISLRGRPVVKPGPDRGMVFQEFDQLLPWKTVKQNIVFALRAARRTPRREAGEIAMEHLAKVKLTKFADAYPHTLSGGMKQRTAIARCLAIRPEIVLMDEPFASLDAQSREQMQQELLRLWEEYQFTLLFVTHSISESLALGSRVLLFSPHPGRLRADLPVQDNSHPGSGELFTKIQRTLSEEATEYAT